jgi:hypothetical protein
MVKVDDTTEAQLKALADTEVAAIRERLRRRTAAARDFAAASARINEAAATWGRIQGEATTAKARAVKDLIDSDMKPAEVAQLLGLNAKELRAIRTTGPAEARQDVETGAPVTPEAGTASSAA